MTDPATRKPVTSSGYYVTVYKKDGGAWRAISDIASPGTETQPAMQKEGNQ